MRRDLLRFGWWSLMIGWSAATLTVSALLGNWWGVAVNAVVLPVFCLAAFGASLTLTEREEARL